MTGYLLQAELLVEAFNTSASVNQLLLAGIERVTLGADFNSDILLSRPGLKHGTTSTANGSLLIIGMDSLLHVCSPLSVSSQGAKRPQNLKPDYYSTAFPGLQPLIQYFSDPQFFAVSRHPFAGVSARHDAISYAKQKIMLDILIERDIINSVVWTISSAGRACA